MKTKVVHCKRESYDEYVGRPSDWGNPFALKDGYSREDAICDYRKWILTRPDLLRRIPELRGKVLGCWCHPKECHGDVLAEFCNDWSDEQLDELIEAVEIMQGMNK